MSRLRPSRPGRALTAAAALVVLTPLALAAGGASRASAATAPTTAAAPARPVVRTLPTGLRVAVRTDAGRTTVSALPAKGAPASYASASVGGTTYVVPTAAQAGLGTRYALDDFRVAGPAPAAISPSFRQFTVTVDVTRRTGAASSGDFVFAQNVDDGRIPFSVGFTSHGKVAFSLPGGHYFLTGFLIGPGSVVSLPVVPEATVSGPTTLALDARTATAAPTLVTPRPSTVVDTELTVTRTARHHGFPSSFGAGAGQGQRVFVTPVTAPPTYGTLTSDVYLRAAGDGYLYDTDYPSPRSTPVPADETFAPPASAFASGTTRYFSDGPTVTALEDRADFSPGSFFVFRLLLPVLRPSARTDYVLAEPDLQWSQTAIADADAFVGFTVADSSTYAPGSDTSADWFRDPATAQPTFPGQGPCAACRQGSTAFIGYQDFGDPSPHHLTFDDFPSTPGLTESAALTVAAGGHVLDSEPGAFSFLSNLPAATQDYSLHLTTVRRGDGYALSTGTDTTWTVPSGARSGLRVPDGSCYVTASTAQCRALPVITPVWTLPTSLDGQLPVGPATLGLVLHDPLGRPFPQVDAVSAQVSYDGGTTSTPATVSRSGAAYAVSFTAPPSTHTSRYGDLTLTARAADGAQVTQTIQRAFGLARGGVAATASGRTGAVPAGCATARSGFAHCDALVATRAAGSQPATARQRAAAPAAGDLPDGYGPADLHAAYDLPASGGSGRTVAIVDAFSDPRAAQDLAVYRRTYGLPACTTASGCLRIVNQRGASSPLPPPDAGWATEISLDLDAVSAACPDCRILLVEGDDNSFASLATAVDRAAKLGAVAVSNSYGAGEFAQMGRYAKSYRHPGTAITASSGDGGFGPAQFPAVLTSVVGVGGTTLTHQPDGGYASSAWSGAGSGCSAYVPKPAWQHDRHCSMRTVSDISTVADPATGLAVYDSYQTAPEYGQSWLVFGGTSAASPVVAALYALAGTAAGVDDAAALYAAPGGTIDDVRGGSNGFCGRDYLCTGVRGYDGPTGVGSPSGVGAFG